MDIVQFIAGLPKAELHMHIEGSIEPELMFELANRNDTSLRWNSPEEIRAAYRFENLQAFLDLYYDGCRVLMTPQDFYEVTRAYLRRAHQENVRHAEMFIGPQGHTRRGVALATVMEGTLAAMQEAQRDDGISSGLLLGAQRHLPEADALAMLDAAMPWADRILGFGLGGAEVGNPPAKFSNFFKGCRERGFRVTAHAGEEGPADYVRASVDILQVDRIDHGNACMGDPGLVQQLAASSIPLTVCPLSNLRLQVVDSLAEHPLAAMLEAGLHVTLNSDDPSYFGAYINENFIQCQTALGLSAAQIAQLARNSFSASFLAPDKIRHHLSTVNAWHTLFTREAAAA